MSKKSSVASNPAAEPAGGLRASALPRLAAEFFVVFLGVYSAFLLDGCRARDEDERKRQQILRLLAEDFAEGSEALGSLTEWFETSLGEPMLDAMAKGERAKLRPVPLPATLDWDGWGAMLSAGGLDVLDAGLIRNVEKTIGQMQQLSDVAAQYNDYVRTVLVPNLDQPIDHFYVDDSTRLRSQYLWYWYSLNGYRAGLARAETLFTDLTTRLGHATQTLGSPGGTP
ncbi:MAG: hypothetical protein AAGK22_18230 [Acidobacteriota bacterium]